MELVHRRPLDRLVNVFHKVHRYECRSTSCGWEGVLQSSHRRSAKRAGRTKTWMWLVVLLIATAAAVALVVYLDTRPAAEPGVEASP